MTSSPPPFDELVSAYLDGEATAEEVARVENSAELMAEVRRLQAVTQRVASPEQVPAPPAGQREIHLATALAAFDTTLSATPITGSPPSSEPTIVQGSSESANVISLEERRSRRSLFGGRALSVAAAMVLLVLGAAALFSFNGGSSNDFETADAVSDAAESATDAASDTSEAVSGSASLNRATNAMDDTTMDDATMDDATMDDDDAMEEDAMEEDAMEEDAMEEAMEEEEADGRSSSSAAGQTADGDTAGDADDTASADSPAPETASAASEPQKLQPDDLTMFLQLTDIDPVAGDRYWLGSIPLNAVSLVLDQRTTPNDGPTPRTDCQLETPILDSNPEPTLLGFALVDGAAVQIHQLPGTDTALLLDATSCAVINEVPASN